MSYKGCFFVTFLLFNKRRCKGTKKNRHSQGNVEFFVVESQKSKVERCFQECQECQECQSATTKIRTMAKGRRAKGERNDGLRVTGYGLPVTGYGKSLGLTGLKHW